VTIVNTRTGYLQGWRYEFEGGWGDIALSKDLLNTKNIKFKKSLVVHVPLSSYGGAALG